MNLKGVFVVNLFKSLVKSSLLVILILFVSTSLFAGLDKGDLLPEFTLRNINGKDVSLADLVGKYKVLIYFWTPVYSPNVNDVVLLNEYQAKHDDVKVLAIINIPENKKEVWRLIKEHKLKLTHLIDHDGDVSLKYDAENAYPVIYIADKDGHVVYRQRGGTLTPFLLEDVLRDRALVDIPAAEETKEAVSLARIGDIVDVVGQKVYFRKINNTKLSEGENLLIYKETGLSNVRGKRERVVIGKLVVERMQSAMLGRGRIIRAVQLLEKGMKVTLTARRWNEEAKKYVGQLDKEEDMYLLATELDPELSDTYLNLGIMYMGRKQTIKAVAAFRTALSKKVSNSSVYFYLGLIDYDQENYTGAIDNLEIAIQHNKKHIDAFYNLGSIYYNHTKNVDKAIEYFQKVVELKPKHTRVHTNLGLCYEQRGLFELAIESYKKAIAVAPDDKWTSIAKQHLEVVEALFAIEKKK